MISRRSRPAAGFTLVELAVVLAVTAVLFTGVYRLLTSGNQQVKDSAAASQQAQLLSSVKNFLSSTDGQTFLGEIVCPYNGMCAIGSVHALPLPATAGNCSGLFIPIGGAELTQAEATWCSILPSGFTSATVNSYGQTFQIGVQAGSATTANNTPPATYSFMIVTTGPVIPDTDGGRISSLIGSDGGFIYTSTGACAANTACGAYGAWTADPTKFGLPAGTAGTVASRTYVAVEQEANLPWLARIKVPGDNGNPTPTFNTLATPPTGSTDLWLNGTGVGASALNSLHGTGDTTGGYNNTPGFGGTIDAVNFLLAGNNDCAIPSNGINPAGCSAPESIAMTLSGPIDTQGSTPGLPCIASTAAPSGGSTVFKTATQETCHAVLLINGNQATTGMVQANILWASSFIYGTNTSDIRLKKDIKPLGDALADVMKLKPVTFRYKQDNRAQIGFIAQDIQKIYPQMVIGRPDNVLGVDYMQMLAPLVSSVQELKKENDQLRQQLKDQASQIRNLQNHSTEN